MIDKLIGILRPFRFRGKHRLLDLVAPDEGSRNGQVFGLRFELDLTDWIQRSIYLGTYEPVETRLVTAFLKPGMTVVDIGANVGYYTALAASRVGPQGRIYAIEPDSRAFSQLENLIANNRIPARAFHVGLGEKSGEEHLYQSPDSHNNTPTMIAHGGFAPKAAISTRKLDDCLDEWQVPRVDLLKIDVEGWEPRILEGASRSLAAGRIDAILCEFNDYWLRAIGSSTRSLWTMLAAFGYRPQPDVDVDRLLGRDLFNCLLIRRN
jgi:FkbM family methyltransferase